MGVFEMTCCQIGWFLSWVRDKNNTGRKRIGFAIALFPSEVLPPSRVFQNLRSMCSCFLRFIDENALVAFVPKIQNSVFVKNQFSIRAELSGYNELIHKLWAE